MAGIEIQAQVDDVLNLGDLVYNKFERAIVSQ